MKVAQTHVSIKNIVGVKNSPFHSSLLPLMRMNTFQEQNSESPGAGTHEKQQNHFDSLLLTH